MDISELLAFSVKNKASDLHLSAGLPPMIRVHGDVRRINLPPLEHKDVHGMIYDIMNDAQRKQYDENLETDFSFDLPGLARFRVNAFNQDRGAAAVLRTIPSRVLSLEELQAPRVFADFSQRPRGLVLVTGPTGSGKSTTRSIVLAAEDVCNVPNTRWPVSAAVSASRIVSRSRNSPTSTMSGSSRSAERKALANDSVCGPTSRWLITDLRDS